MNTHRYLPMTEEDKKEMLATIGVDSIEALFADIPESTRFKGQLAIEAALKEPELIAHFLKSLLMKTNRLKRTRPF